MSAVNASPLSNPPSASAPPLSMEVWGGTDPGRVRSQNEDAVWPEGRGTPLSDGSYLFLVADGVGGAQAGATASRITTEEIVRHCQSVRLTNPGQALALAVQAANTAVYNYVTGSPTVNEAASTVTVALVKEGQVHVSNVGDSRTYLIRNGTARQLTRDHTLTQQKIDSGRINQAQADLDEDRSVITRSLGSGPTVQVDVFPPLPLQPGDTLLLCSDGLTDMLSEADIARIAGRKPPQPAVSRLIVEANRRGGYDNISVVIGQVPGRPTLAGRGWSHTLLLIGGLLLVMAILLVVGGSLLGQPPITATARGTPTALAGVVVGATPTPSPAAPTPSTTPTAPAVIATAPPDRFPTSTPLPTYTPAPIPTLAGPPPTSPPTEGVPSTSPGQPTLTPIPQVSAPMLLDPLDGANAIQGRGTTFKWRWNGELTEGWGFEVRIWKAGDPDHFGAFAAHEMMQYVARQPDDIYAVTLLVEGAYSVQRHGAGEYQWSVAVVRLDPYLPIGAEASPYRLFYVVPGSPSNGRGGDGNGGGSGGKGGEPPPP